MLLIITGCIKVNDNTPYVAVRDDRLRLDDYISTIKWAIESEVFDKIVFAIIADMYMMIKKFKISQK